MRSEFALEIPPHREHLALVRLIVGGAAALSPVGDRRLEDLKLAVSEACANAMDAQLRSGSDAPLRISVEVDDDAMVVTVTDHAGGFEPGALDPLPSVTDPQRLRHERGLGVPLMRSLADLVTFTKVADGTAVRLEIRAPA
ncbi:MAG: ATP-binding protein [Acidimicrobiales bacterium]|nr:ATP-binding protein [Acidimicrobiales bacterium]